MVYFHEADYCINLSHYLQLLAAVLQTKSLIKRQTSGTSSDNEWKRVVQQMTTSENEWQRVVQQVTTSGTMSNNEWYNEWQRMTTNGIKWQRVVQWMITSDNEWQREVQQVTTNDNDWQRVTISTSFSFFQIREEPTTKHPKKHSLKRTFEEGLLN